MLLYVRITKGRPRKRVALASASCLILAFVVYLLATRAPNNSSEQNPGTGLVASTNIPDDSKKPNKPEKHVRHGADSTQSDELNTPKEKPETAQELTASDSIPDPRPRAYSTQHVSKLLEVDNWLNPTGRKFNSEEMASIQNFVNADGAVARELDEAFYRDLNSLGKEYLSSHRIDGQVDIRGMPQEERDKLPYSTKDWMKPVFFEDRGSLHTWVQIDLETEAPQLASLRIRAWQEMADARRRLREYILAMPERK